MGLQSRPNTINWYYCFQLKGTRYFGSTGTPNKTIAAQVEREVRTKAHASSYLSAAEEISLGDALNRYSQSRKSKRGWKGIESLRRKLVGVSYDNRQHESISCFGLNPSQKLHDLTTRTAERLVAARRSEGLSEASIKHEIGLLRATSNEMRRLGYRTNADVAWPRLKTNSRLRYLDPIEEMRLVIELKPTTLKNASTSSQAWSAHQHEIHAMSQDNYDLVVFLLDTGCRYSEATTMSWTSVDLVLKTVNVFRSKVQNEGFIHMTDRLFDVLARRFSDRRPNQKYIFESKVGGHRGYATNAIRKAIVRAGLNDPDVVRTKGGKVTLHTLRHTFASKLVREGLSLYDVSSLLGHSDSKMTQRYAHLAPNHASMRAVAVLNRLGES